MRLIKRLAISPAIRAMAKPWKMGSARMTAAPTTTAMAVSNIGRNRTAPASITASLRGMPSRSRCSIKSTRMMEFLTTIPPPAMKPIMLVAVKKASIMPCAGRMPTREKGMAIMTIAGVMNALATPELGWGSWGKGTTGWGSPSSINDFTGMMADLGLDITGPMSGLQTAAVNDLLGQYSGPKGLFDATTFSDKKKGFVSTLMRELNDPMAETIGKGLGLESYQAGRIAANFLGGMKNIMDKNLVDVYSEIKGKLERGDYGDLGGNWGNGFSGGFSATPSSGFTGALSGFDAVANALGIDTGLNFGGGLTRGDIARGLAGLADRESGGFYGGESMGGGWGEGIESGDVSPDNSGYDDGDVHGEY